MLCLTGDVFDVKPEVKVRTNCRIKQYKDGTKNYIVCREQLFRDPYDENIDEDERREKRQEQRQHRIDLIKQYLGVDTLKGVEPALISEAKACLFGGHEIVDSLEVRPDSLKRAKDSIFDYILNNDFQYFFTGTIDPEKLDSTDPKELIKPLQKWLNNLRHRYGLSYVMVAEHHKSGRIHFHGLFNSELPLKLVDSGTKLYKGYNKPVSNERAELLGLSGGRTVYNLTSWRFGWSTCVQLQGDPLNTAFYVTKYITKDCKKIFGRFFWHSRDLKKPDMIYTDVEFDEFDGLDFGGFKYRFERGGDSDTK